MSLLVNEYMMWQMWDIEGGERTYKCVSVEAQVKYELQREIVIVAFIYHVFIFFSYRLLATLQ